MIPPKKLQALVISITESTYELEIEGEVFLVPKREVWKSDPDDLDNALPGTAVEVTIDGFWYYDFMKERL